MDFLRKVYRGEYPLYRMYWIYCCLVNTILRLLNVYVISPVLKARGEKLFLFIGPSGFLFLSCFVIAVGWLWYFLLSVGMWRASNRYLYDPFKPGRSLYAGFAKLTSVALILISLFELFSFLIELYKITFDPFGAYVAFVIVGCFAFWFVFYYCKEK